MGNAWRIRHFQSNILRDSSGNDCHAVVVSDSDVMEADDLDAVSAIESDTVVTVVVDEAGVTTRMRGRQLTQVQWRLSAWMQL